MPGFRIRTDLDTDKSLKLARRAGLDLGFTLSDEKGCSFTASRGSRALSILAGGLLSYSSFDVKVEQGVGGSEIVIGGQSWASTGLVGQGREARAVKSYADAVIACIHQEGGKVLASNEL